MKAGDDILCTSFGGNPVCAVLGTVAGNHFVVASITTQWECNLDDVVAGLHKHQNTLHLLLLLVQRHLALHVFDEAILGNLTTAMEEVLDHVKETWILGSWHVL